MAEFWRGYLFGFASMFGVTAALVIIVVNEYMRPFR
jgi:hypothetical protein